MEHANSNWVTVFDLEGATILNILSSFQWLKHQTISGILFYGILCTTVLTGSNLDLQYVTKYRDMLIFMATINMQSVTNIFLFSPVFSVDVNRDLLGDT